MPLSVTKHLNSVLRQVCVKGNVSFIFEEDFVDHKVNKPMRLLYSTDLVHLNSERPVTLAEEGQGVLGTCHSTEETWSAKC